MTISREQQAKINEIGKKYNLDFVILHGSRVTGKIVTQHPDIDIAIYRRGGIPSEEYLQLVNTFMGIFGNDIDLKTLHKKDPLFLYLALRDSILLYGKRYSYNEVKAYSFRRYIEAKSLFELRDLLLKRGIESLKRDYAISYD